MNLDNNVSNEHKSNLTFRVHLEKQFIVLVD